MHNIISSIPKIVSFKKLKSVPLKEEYMTLTKGDMMKSLIIQQMLYWTERVNDFDEFIEEEKERALKGAPIYEVNIQSCHGWIYKSAAQICKELFLPKNKEETVRRCFKSLVKDGIFERRKNPKDNEDKIYQYRVDLLTLRSNLNKIGYELQGYKFDGIDVEYNVSNSHNTLNHLNPQNEGRYPQNEGRYPQNEGRYPQNEGYKENIYKENKKDKEEEEENFLLKKDFRPSDSVMNEIKKQFLCSDEALEEALAEFKDFYIKNKVEKRNWEQIFENWCVNRKSWKVKVKEDILREETDEDVLAGREGEEREIMMHLLREYGKPIFKSWLNHLKLIDSNNDCVRFKVPTNFIKEWIGTNYLETIKRVINALKPGLNRNVVLC